MRSKRKMESVSLSSFPSPQKKSTSREGKKETHNLKKGNDVKEKLTSRASISAVSAVFINAKALPSRRSLSESET